MKVGYQVGKIHPLEGTIGVRLHLGLMGMEMEVRGSSMGKAEVDDTSLALPIRAKTRTRGDLVQREVIPVVIKAAKDKGKDKDRDRDSRGRGIRVGRRVLEGKDRMRTGMGMGMPMRMRKGTRKGSPCRLI
jgi:hypothetical protein